MNRLTLLKSLSFGSQVAEEEVGRLQDYFVKPLTSATFAGEIFPE